MHRILSFKYALAGITSAVREEPNLKIHLFIALLVILLGILFGITQTEWLFIIILIGLVISLELTNTAIEAVVNAFTDKEHPGAKLAKDISAGAVLVTAITSIIVGLIIFLSYIHFE